MARDITVTFGDGTTHVYRNAPDSVTPEQVDQRARIEFGKDIVSIDGGRATGGASVSATPDDQKGSYLGSLVGNIPSGLGRMLTGMGQFVSHPLDSAAAALELGYGGLKNLGAAGVRNAQGPNALSLPGPLSALSMLAAKAPAGPTEQAATAKANAFGQQKAQQYGSLDAALNTLREDPVGTMMDASTVLGLGGGLLKGTTAGNVLNTASNVTNPVWLGGKAITKVVGPALAQVIGNMGTHTGARPIVTAAEAGAKGGQPLYDFWNNLTGRVPMTDVVDAAKQNLTQMKIDKNAAYRTAMDANVVKDPTVLDIRPIQQAVQDAIDQTSFKGAVVDPAAAKALADVRKVVTGWAINPDPAFKTPIGLDALKQRVHAIVEAIPYEQKNARRAVSGVERTIKSTIEAQAPEYGKIMSAYNEAQTLIDELQGTLSLGDKARADTALRKLQSVMRDNAQSNWSNRANLTKKLVDQGGTDIMPALAGQAMSSWTSRGLFGPFTTGALAAGAWPTHGLTLAAYPLTMPKVVGATSLGLGIANRLLPDPLSQELAAQTGLLNQ